MTSVCIRLHSFSAHRPNFENLFFSEGRVSLSLSLSSTCCWPSSWMDGLGVPTQCIWRRLWERRKGHELSVNDGRFYICQPCVVSDNTIVRHVSCPLLYYKHFATDYLTQHRYTFDITARLINMDRKA